MTFHTDSFFYLQFWNAAVNTLIYWELLRMYNGMNRPRKVTEGHWVVKFIRILTRTGKWAKVTFGLRQLVTRL